MRPLAVLPLSLGLASRGDEGAAPSGDLDRHELVRSQGEGEDRVDHPGLVERLVKIVEDRR